MYPHNELSHVLRPGRLTGHCSGAGKTSDPRPIYRFGNFSSRNCRTVSGKRAGALSCCSHTESRKPSLSNSCILRANCQAVPGRSVRIAGSAVGRRLFSSAAMACHKSWSQHMWQFVVEIHQRSCLQDPLPNYGVKRCCQTGICYDRRISSAKDEPPNLSPRNLMSWNDGLHTDAMDS